MPGISMMSKCGLRTENRFQKSETDVLVPKIWLLHAYYCWRDIWRSDQLNPHSCSKSPVPIFNDAMKRGLGESVFHYRFLAFAGDSTAYEKLRQPYNGSTEILKLVFIKRQLNSKWIYEVIVSSKIPTKNYRDFCPGSLSEGRAEIWKKFGWHFGRNDDLINSFWI